MEWQPCPIFQFDVQKPKEVIVATFLGLLRKMYVYVGLAPKGITFHIPSLEIQKTQAASILILDVKYYAKYVDGFMGNLGDLSRHDSASK